MKWIDFVKDYAKKNNIKYGEALKKAKGDWAKHKANSSEHKSKTKKTTKKNNISMNIRDLKKKQKVKNLGDKLQKDELRKISSQEKQLEKDYLDSIEKSKTEAQLIAEGRTPAEAKLSVAKQNIKVEKLKKKVVGGGSLDVDENILKGVRKTQIAKYKKLKVKVEKDIKEGKRNNKEYNSLLTLAKHLAGNSKTNQYAKAVKKLEKAIATRGFEKASRRQMKQEQREKILQDKLVRNVAQESKRGETTARQKVFETRKRQLVRLGATEEEATAIANEEKTQQKESADLQRTLQLEKFRKTTTTKSQTGGLTYQQFVEKTAKTRSIPYSQAQSLVKQNNLFKKYQISAVQQASNPVSNSVILPAVQTAIPTSLVGRGKFINKDGSVSKKVLDAISRIKGSFSNNNSVLFNDYSTKTKTQADLKRLKEYLKIPQLGKELTTLTNIDNKLQAWYDSELVAYKESLKPKRVIPNTPKSAKKKTQQTSSTPSSPAPSSPAPSSPIQKTADALIQSVASSSPKTKIKFKPQKTGTDTTKKPLLPLPPLQINQPRNREIDTNKWPKDYNGFRASNAIKEKILKIETDATLSNEARRVAIQGLDIGLSKEDENLKRSILKDYGVSGSGLNLDEKYDDVYGEDDMVNDEDLEEEGGAFNIKSKVNSMKNALVRKMNVLPITPISNAVIKGYGAYKGRKAEKVNKIHDKHRIDLDLSNESYADTEKRKMEMNGYKYVPKASNKEHAIYVNEATKKVILAYRGSTMGKDFVDDWLKSDKAIAMNKFETSDRFKREKEWTKDMLNLLPKNYKVSTTGHSLGGTIAMEMGHLFKLPSVVFNAGVSTNHAKKFKDDNVNFYHAKGDAVSLLGVGHLKNTIMVDNDAGNLGSAHGTGAFYGKDEGGLSKENTKYQTEVKNEPKVESTPKETKKEIKASEEAQPTNEDELAKSEVVKQFNNKILPQADSDGTISRMMPNANYTILNPSHYGDLGDFTQLGQEDPSNWTARDLSTYSDSWGGVGGSFAKLSENKVNSIVDDIGKYSNTYTPQNLDKMLGGKLDLSSYKVIKDTHDKHLDKIKYGIKVLKNYHKRIDNANVKDLLNSHIGQIQHKLGYFQKNIAPLIPKILEDKLSKRLNHDNRSLTDTAIHQDTSMIKGGNIENVKRGMKGTDNLKNLSKAPSQVLKSNPNLDHKDHNFMERMMAKLMKNLGKKIISKMRGGNLSSQDYKNIKFHTGMDYHKLKSHPHFDMVLKGGNFLDDLVNAGSTILPFVI